MSDKTIEWPSAVVASMVIILIGAVTITAIIHYDTIDETLEIWQAMGTVVGLLTGAFVTYFFTQGATQAAQVQARNAASLASQQARRADVTQQALTKVAGLLDPARWDELLKDPLIRVATSLADDSPNCNGAPPTN